jgi:hypothetical protein
MKELVDLGYLIKSEIGEKVVYGLPKDNKKIKPEVKHEDKSTIKKEKRIDKVIITEPLTRLRGLIIEDMGLTNRENQPIKLHLHLLNELEQEAK